MKTYRFAWILPPVFFGGKFVEILFSEQVDHVLCSSNQSTPSEISNIPNMFRYTICYIARVQLLDTKWVFKLLSLRIAQDNQLVHFAETTALDLTWKGINITVNSAIVSASYASKGAKDARLWDSKCNYEDGKWSKFTPRWTLKTTRIMLKKLLVVLRLIRRCKLTINMNRSGRVGHAIFT